MQGGRAPLPEGGEGREKLRGIAPSPALPRFRRFIPPDRADGGPTRGERPPPGPDPARQEGFPIFEAVRFPNRLPQLP